MIARDDAARRRFIQAHAKLGHPPLTPEITLWLAEEATTLWEASEAFLDAEGLPPPFWAFAWAGGQALARYVLDHPETVRAKRTLDFGSGGGVVAVAALRAGAISARAADLDPFAAAAAALNGAANGVAPLPFTGDATTLDARDFDVVLAADVCYDRTQATPATAWLDAAASAGVQVLIGDPGRSYLATERLVPLAAYDVVTPVELEQNPVTPTQVWRVSPAN